MSYSTIMYAGTVSDHLFPKANRYTIHSTAQAKQIAESTMPPGLDVFSERHLQCIWYDPELRPDTLQTITGESITVIDPGIWNLEEGPDFLGAHLIIGAHEREIRGDIEIHRTPSGWIHHGHHHNPRYNNVIAHVTYAKGPMPDKDILPDNMLHIAIKDALRANPTFSFDAIDVIGYPYAARATQTPCYSILKQCPTTILEHLLDAAGEERLRRKAERFKISIAEQGAEQTLYEAFMSALGYKHNKAPFQYLAQKIPIHILKNETDNNPVKMYAILAGASGLLPEEINPKWDNDSKQFIRIIWDYWWKERSRWITACIPREMWKLSNLRPTNHPLRRLEACTHLFASHTPVNTMIQDIAKRQSDTFIKSTHDVLSNIPAGFWSHHLAYTKALSKPMALLGASRINAIIINIIIPCIAAMNIQEPFKQGLLTHLPKESDNSIVRQTAHTLLGRDHSPALYNSGLRQQGLIQIFSDFCLNDRSRCAACRLPELIEQFHAKNHP